MTSITMPFLALVAVAIVCALVSCLVAVVMIPEMAKRHVREAIYQAVEDAHCILVREVSCNVTVTAEDGSLVVRRQMATTGPQVTANFVERWLDSRDLVMAPKGRDFSTKVKSS